MRQRILAGIILSLPAVSTHAASFIPLGAYDTWAKAISADGMTVVGTSNAYPFQWTMTSGLQPIAGGNFFAVGTGVSGDGSVVVGTDDFEGVWRWTAATGYEYLAPAYNFIDFVATSANGGTTAFSQFRWTQAAGVQAFGGINDSARAVAADGSVIVGAGANGNAFRWTAQTGMVDLGRLAGGSSPVSFASAVSTNGSVIAGMSTSDSPCERELFRWTEASGMVGLGFPSGCGAFNVGIGISGDGSVIVGGSGFSTAFIWTEASGMQSLQDLLLARGATGMSGYRLGEIGGISADGRYITGTASSPTGQWVGFWADLSPVPVPAAAWLLGSALAVLGYLRRQIVSN